MSSPRAATSVAIKSGQSLLRKSSTARLLSGWLLSPWTLLQRNSRCNMLSRRAASFLYRANTRIRLFFFRWYRFKSSRNRWKRSRSAITSTVCCTRWLLVSSSVPTVIFTGLLRNVAASCRMLSGQVALNITVCRSGGGMQFAMIAFTSRSKPKSSILSASSNTRYSTASSTRPPSFSRSRKRPGVATTTTPFGLLAPFCSLLSC
mmetsp:Transcript_19011/g.71914  ORF Transcript_19011/g.71914 Transcript_19011/m.71914 type:complete len:205 (-) Transcript_19011:792-1406(-)